METTAKVKSIVFWNDSTLGKPVIILLGGKIGVGKTTTAQMLNTIFFQGGFTAGVESIAKFVKTSALDYFDWDERKDDRGRRLLQDIGRTGRSYDQDIWIRKLFDYLDMNFLFLPDFIIIDDWRYTNELEWLKDRLYTVIKIKITSSVRGVDSDDESEHNLDEFSDYDFTIQNDTHVLDSYMDQLREFVSKKLLKKEENKNV